MKVEINEKGIRFIRESWKEWFYFRVSYQYQMTCPVWKEGKGIPRGYVAYHGDPGIDDIHYCLFLLLPFVLIQRFTSNKNQNIRRIFERKFHMLTYDEGVMRPWYWFIHLHLPKK